MRLIIKEYLAFLKEKDELDLLLCDLLLQMGYATHNVPKTGNRQFGVDIRASNKNEMCLFVIKQGNINRNNWDNGPNSVRQSLNEICDCYSSLIVGSDRKKKLRIIVATNGMIDEAVGPNWECFKKGYKIDGKKVDIECWDIDTITKFIQQYLFDEYIFGNQKRSLLRKALYYVEESDYRKTYYEQIIDCFINELSAERTMKKQEKILSGLFLASQMIAYYAADFGRYKIGIMVSEYLIIRYWKFLLEYNYFEKEKYLKWLKKFCDKYEKWNKEYFNKIKFCCQIKNSLFINNPVEQRVILYEILGFLTSYANYLSYIKNNNEELNEVIEIIVALFNNYHQIYYPPYDDNICELTMIYRLFYRLGNIKNLMEIITLQCVVLRHYYLQYNKYSSPVDTFEDAVNIDMGFPAEEYNTSVFWGMMLEWIVLLDMNELYDCIKDFLIKDLRKVTKCIWFLKTNEELKLYDVNVMYLAGTAATIEVEESFEKTKEIVTMIMNETNSEVFSFEKYCFPALEYIICRYWRTLPRVKVTT